jgi:hypothetical protein
LHPVVLELWNIREGRLQIDDRGQEEVWSDFGAMLGTFGGAWAGAATSVVAGRRNGASLAGTVEAGARMGARATRRLSALVSSPFANYREVMIAVPGVRHPGTEPCAFVLQMYSDSLFAVTGARVGGYGYNKVLANIVARDDRWIVTDRGGLQVLDVSLRVEQLADVVEQPRNAEVLRWMQGPLLGRTEQSIKISYVQRGVDEPGVRFATASGAIGVGPEPLTGHATTGSFSSQQPLGGVAYSNLFARVSRASRLPSSAP